MATVLWRTLPIGAKLADGDGTMRELIEVCEGRRSRFPDALYHVQTWRKSDGEVSFSWVSKRPEDWDCIPDDLLKTLEIPPGIWIVGTFKPWEPEKS